MRMDLTSASAQALNQAIQKLADESQKEIKETLTKQARLLCVDFAINTRPLEKGAGGKIRGDANVAKKILNVYVPVDAAIAMLEHHKKGYGAAFARMVKQGKLTEAGVFLGQYTRKKFTVGPFDGGQLHRQQAFIKQRVNKRLVVLDYESTVEKYVTLVKKRVGYAKGGFATAARELGGARGIPGFASRHSSPGKGSVTGDGKSLTVTIENGVKYARLALEPDKEKQALDYRTRQIESVLKRMAARKGKIP